MSLTYFCKTSNIWHNDSATNLPMGFDNIVQVILSFLRLYFVKLHVCCRLPVASGPKNDSWILIPLLWMKPSSTFMGFKVYFEIWTYDNGIASNADITLFLNDILKWQLVISEWMRSSRTRVWRSRMMWSKEYSQCNGWYLVNHECLVIQIFSTYLSGLFLQ